MVDEYKTSAFRGFVDVDDLLSGEYNKGEGDRGVFMVIKYKGESYGIDNENAIKEILKYGR